MIRRTLAFAALAGLLCSCASAPPGPAAPQYRAPWADTGKPDFRDLLVSYGAANLLTHRDSTQDRYLRPQTKTFDRYVAAKEVDVGIEPLQQEALAEIQAAALGLRAKQFLVRTQLTVHAYDPQLGGFPLYQKSFDQNAGLRHTNEDVRTGRSAAGRTQGMSVISKD